MAHTRRPNATNAASSPMRCTTRNNMALTAAAAHKSSAFASMPQVCAARPA